MTTATAPNQVPAGLVLASDELFEIVGGRRVEKKSMGAFATWLASRLFLKLGPFVETHQLGQVVAECLVHLPAPSRNDRRPDLLFVSYTRWPKELPLPPTDNAWNVVPNLVVEVVSPTDIAESVQAKIAEYFRAGVDEVWVVYPLQRSVHLYRSPRDIAVVTDILDGGRVLPGFRLTLAELFGPASIDPITPTL